jgi:hypothetical protein
VLVASAIFLPSFRLHVTVWAEKLFPWWKISYDWGTKRGLEAKRQKGRKTVAAVIFVWCVSLSVVAQRKEIS